MAKNKLLKKMMILSKSKNSVQEQIQKKEEEKKLAKQQQEQELKKIEIQKPVLQKIPKKKLQVLIEDEEDMEIKNEDNNTAYKQNKEFKHKKIQKTKNKLQNFQIFHQEKQKEEYYENNEEDFYQENIYTERQNYSQKRILCFSDTILDSIQTIELQNHLIGQLARCFCLFRINEVIIYHNNSYEKLYTSLPANEFIAKILQHLETPQYLKKRLFKISDNLKYVGLIKPLECQHHLKRQEFSEFREGVVLKRPTKNNQESWVDIGLDKECKIQYSIPEGVRVTVQLENHRFNKGKFFSGSLVNAKQVEQQTGKYWGYNVSISNSLQEVFEKVDKNSLNILIDSDEATSWQDIEEKVKYDRQYSENVFLFFSSEGIKNLFDSENKKNISFDSFLRKFHYRFSPQSNLFGLKNIHVEEQIFYYCGRVFNQLELIIDVIFNPQ